MSKNKFLFCGLMAFALGLGVVTESVNSNIVAKADGEVNLGTLVVNSVNGSEGANGFYISMKSTNALPFDPGWQFTSFTSSMKCFLNETAFNVRIKKLAENSYYVCLSDDGAQATAAGDIFILEGDYTYTHSDATVYNYSIAKSRFKFDGSKWLKDVYYSDAELESYDYVTLKDVNIPDIDSTAVRDYQKPMSALDSAFAANPTNTTGSQIFSFLYTGGTTGDGTGFDIRLRGTPQSWDGYRFVFNNSWGAEGICVARKDDSVRYSGDIPIKLNGSTDSLIELGAIDVKDSDLTWLFVKQDGSLLFTDVVDTVAGWTNPTSGFYISKGSDSCVQRFKSTNKGYSNEIASGQAVVNSDISTIGGIYFSTATDNIVPASTSLSFVSYILDPSTVTINGAPIYTDQKVAIKKVDTSLYYLIFSDYGIVPQTNDLLIVEGPFAYYDSDAVRKYTYSFSPMAVTFNGTKWTQINNFLNVLADTVDDDLDYTYYNDTGLQEINDILGEKVPQIMASTNSFNAAFRIFNETKTLLSLVEQDEQHAAQALADAKSAACLELEAYVNESNYSSNNWNAIQSLITNGKAAINECTKVSQVNTALAEAKASIDAVEDYETEAINSVKNRKAGYEIFLENYDIASLSSINYSQLAFKAYKGDGVQDNEAIITDFGLTEHNKFATSEENTTSSVIFQFIYNINTLESGKYGAIFIRLRGVPYFGYRFRLATNEGGCGIDRFESDAVNSTVGNVSGCFQINKDYKVQLGAIDIARTNKVWLFITVDGNYVISEVVDKISFATNNHIGISDSYMAQGSSGVALLKDCREGVTTNTPSVILDSITPAGGDYGCIYFDSTDTLPYDSDWRFVSYPMSNDAVTVNGDPICNIERGIFKKFTSTQYYVMLSENSTFVEPGDIVTINGDFVTFNVDTGEKTYFTVKKTSMQFCAADATHASDYWVPYVTELDVAEEVISDVSPVLSLSYSYSENAGVYTSEFRLLVGLDSDVREAFDGHDEISYGIEITSAGDKEMTVAFSEVTTREDTDAGVEYIVVSLGDILNNIANANVELTIKAFATVGTTTVYGVSRTVSVLSMIDTYYADIATQDIVAPVYNILHDGHDE